MAAGRAAQAGIVVTTMNKLPATVDERMRVICEEQLVAQGRVTEPGPLGVSDVLCKCCGPILR